MATNQSPVDDMYNQTLGDLLALAGHLLAESNVTLSLGEMWMRRKSDASFSVSQALVRLSCWVAQAMGARSQLQYWMATNGYATTRTARQILTSWSSGSAQLMALIEALIMVVFFDDMVQNFAPEMVQEMNDFYPA